MLVGLCGRVFCRCLVCFVYVFFFFFFSSRRRHTRCLSDWSSDVCSSDLETNVRLGTQYFKDLIDRFGGVHYALAGYNAGEHRVVRWLSEAPGLPTDELDRKSVV